MSRMFTLKRSGCLALLVMVIGLAAAPPADAAVEAAAQCFQMSPFTVTVKIVRIASEDIPGMQALFVRWRVGSYQMLGTGVRTASVIPGSKDITVSFVRRETGEEFRMTALYNPLTSSGPWTLYGASGQTGTGTLTKVSCDSVED